ncbi:hypothetical protein MHBO_004344 [Bonamia ostreae]|uniref:Uncharacterized protein n=1 Tax=Bonamia ostreae TaxID=126728 RepID=A0ABV2AT23_9EUKA
MLSEKSLIKFYDSFYSRVLEKIVDLYSKRINGLRRIKEKEYSDESQESLKGREEVNQTIMTTFNDRQNLLKLIICRLAASSDFISSKDSDFLNNEIFKAIFGRLVMFLRKFREDIKRMEETLKKAYFDQNQSNPSTKAFKLIIAN